MAIPLAAQDVTVMPPVLFNITDDTYQPVQPDMPPTLLENWSPAFPARLRKTTKSGYAIFTQTLDSKGNRTYSSVNNFNGYYNKIMDDMSALHCAPAQKNGKPVESFSWIGVIFNPASASEKNADATPRILKVAPILVTKKQWNAYVDSLWLIIPGTVEIDTDGAAKNLRLENADKKHAPFMKAMRPEIERSLAGWQFAPARKEGQPVKATLTLDFIVQKEPVFDLEWEKRSQQIGEKLDRLLAEHKAATSAAPEAVGISHGEKVKLTDHLVAGKITVFDFSSRYCPPCMHLSPMLDRLQAKRDDLAVVKVDINRPKIKGIDWKSPVAQQFDLHEIPYLMIYGANGKAVSEGDKAMKTVKGWLKAIGEDTRGL